MADIVLVSTPGVGKVHTNPMPIGFAPPGWDTPGFDDSLWDIPVAETSILPAPVAGAQWICDTPGDVQENHLMEFRLNFTVDHPVDTFLFTSSHLIAGNNVADNIPNSVVTGANLIAAMSGNLFVPSPLYMSWRLDVWLLPFIDDFTDTSFVGGTYSRAPVYGGGTGPYTFAVTSGRLPPGLYLNPLTGTAAGVTVVAGAFVFGLTLTDALGGTDTGSYTITVTQPAYAKIPFGGGGFGGGAGGLGGGAGGPGNPSLPQAAGMGTGTATTLPVISLPWCMKKGCIVT